MTQRGVALRNGVPISWIDMAAALGTIRLPTTLTCRTAAGPRAWRCRVRRVCTRHLLAWLDRCLTQATVVHSS